MESADAHHRPHRERHARRPREVPRRWHGRLHHQTRAPRRAASRLGALALHPPARLAMTRPLTAPKPTDRKLPPRLLATLAMLGAVVLARPALAQPDATGATAVSALKKLSLDQLMDLEVTSVSKRPEKLSEAASAIQ